MRARRVRQDILSVPRAIPGGHTDEVAAVAISPDGQVLASGGKDGAVRLWEPVGGRELARRVPGRADH